MIGLAAGAMAVATIPVSFTGNWVVAHQSCSTGENHVRLYIAANQIDDGEFDARVDRVEKLASNRIRVSVTWLSAEDEQRQIFILTLGGNGLQLSERIVSTDGKALARPKVIGWKRCP
ncbi:hypothetical protein [Novosphingobium sp.]|uniref:hypothetical protein n=1 Tax=Novosphingobium sp. TaxID=1874826 RepID=UPI0035B3DA12